MNETRNRWWEFYFIRYAMGTVLGSLILIYISNRPEFGYLHQVLFSFGTGHTGFQDQVSHAYISHISIGCITAASSYGKFTTILIIAASGLTFCYLASAPFLVLHASRFLGETLKGRNKSDGYIFKTTLLLFALFEIVIFFIFAPKYKQLIFLLLPTFAMVYMTAIGLWILIRANQFKEFYKNLAIARSLKNEWRQEYIESYRHLREHGNSYGIVLAEIIFGMGFLGAGSFGATALILYVGAWSFAPTLIWLAGTSLEWRFVND